MTPQMPEGESPDRSIGVGIVLLDAELPTPQYAHPGDAGADLYAREAVRIDPGERALVATGVALVLPPGCAGFIHPRSGLAARHGITVVNAPGTIDSGYRGEIMVNLLNTDRRHPVDISRGDRIAQLVVQRVLRATFHLLPDVVELPDSARGTSGHGSTGGLQFAAGLTPTRSSDIQLSDTAAMNAVKGAPHEDL